jgi:hypothetical protein
MLQSLFFWLFGLVSGGIFLSFWWLVPKRCPLCKGHAWGPMQLKKGEIAVK